MSAPRRPVLELTYPDGNVYKLDAIKQIRHDAEQIKAIDPFNVKAKMFEDLADYLEQEVTASALRDLAREKDAEAKKLRDAGRAAQREAIILRKAATLKDALDKANKQKGADATRHAASVEHKDLDDEIRACLARGDETSQYIETWALDHPTKSGAPGTATVYRRIRLLKPK